MRMSNVLSLPLQFVCPGLSLMLCQLNAFRPNDFQTKGLELLKGLLSTAAT